MKQKLLILFLIASQFLFAQTEWKMQPVALQTRWAKEVSPNNALKEYPRPQMVRNNWTSLNGLWNYVITNDTNSTNYTNFKWDGQILVPYPVESALSGVKKSLMPEQRLWYRRIFQAAAKARTLLHFGAVDYQCWVYVNGKEVGGHEGGYTAFSFDITDALKNGTNELIVKVYDPSDAGIGPRGKQVLTPANIYYTPSSGIWQTVWMEVVPANYISSLTITPNIDSGFVAVTVNSTTSEPVTLSAGNNKASGKTNQRIKLPVTNSRLWSPSDPYLYDLVIKTGTDEVKSYFGLRKIEVKKDDKGVDRIFLNNKYLFNLGVLDSSK